MSNIETTIRKLARSTYWQQLYTAYKEGNLNLFLNTNTYSGLQITFLYWLRVYNMLYSEMADKEWYMLDEQVLEDPDRTDAFLYYRKKEIEKKIREQKQEERKNKPRKKGVKNYNIYRGPTNKGN